MSYMQAPKIIFSLCIASRILLDQAALPALIFTLPLDRSGK